MTPYLSGITGLQLTLVAMALIAAGLAGLYALWRAQVESKDEFTDPNGWRQGAWGDLCFRLRLFFGRQRIVEVLNQVEGAEAALQAAFMVNPFAEGALNVSREGLIGEAEEQLAAARLALREFVFGHLEPLADPRYDGPDECAAVMDREATTGAVAACMHEPMVIQRDGRVTRMDGRAVPKEAIVTYRRPL